MSAGRDIFFTYVTPGIPAEQSQHSMSIQGWHLSYVYGSQFQLESGIAGTVQSVGSHPLGSFSGDSTVILGTVDKIAMLSISETIASWLLPIDERSVKYFERGFLVVACLRYFGGLHSKRYDAQITISLNNWPIDEFGLRVIPPNHSDYFHRIPTPDVPSIWPISDCQTVYMWPILKERLTRSRNQIVTMRIDNYAWWDIDYVGLLFRSAVQDICT